MITNNTETNEENTQQAESDSVKRLVMPGRCYFIGMRVNLFCGWGEITGSFSSGSKAGLYKVEVIQKWGTAKFNLTSNQVDRHGINECPHCKLGEVEKVKGRPPAHPDYAACDVCDSTYNLA